MIESGTSLKHTHTHICIFAERIYIHTIARHYVDKTQKVTKISLSEAVLPGSAATRTV